MKSSGSKHEYLHVDMVQIKISGGVAGGSKVLSLFWVNTAKM